MDDPVSYILVTNDVYWDTDGFWRKLAKHNNQGHTIHYQPICSDCLSEGKPSSIAQLLDPICTNKPEICWHFPDRNAMTTLKGDTYLSANEKGVQTGGAPCRCRVPVEKDAESQENDDGDVASAFKRGLNLDDLD
jgi:hypothetical protein